LGPELLSESARHHRGHRLISHAGLERCARSGGVRGRSRPGRTGTGVEPLSFRAAIPVATVLRVQPLAPWAMPIAQTGRGPRACGTPRTAGVTHTAHCGAVSLRPLGAAPSRKSARPKRSSQREGAALLRP